MKRKISLNVIVASIFIGIVAVTSTTAIFLSKNREENIYYISTEAGLKSINNDLSGHYVIDSSEDIFLSDGWIPIGDKEHPFTGTLDCNYRTIYVRKFDSEYIVDSANNYSEVLLGLFAVNKGTIKHLGLSYSSNISDYDFATATNNFSLIYGGACAINYGYISMCFVSSSLKIELEEKCNNVTFGGVVGINNKQIRCCSVTNAINLTVGDCKVTCGGFAGTSNRSSKIEYCVRNGFSWVTSTFAEFIYYGQCIGTSYGGSINNISITSSDISESYKTFSYIRSKDICVGGLIGLAIADKLSIHEIYINTSFEVRSCERCKLGFLIGSLQDDSTNVSIKNVVITSSFTNEYSSNYDCGYIFSSSNCKNVKTSTIYVYDIQTFFEFNQAEFVVKKTFDTISLRMVNFDSACWKKEKYSFVLNIEKLKQ